MKKYVYIIVCLSLPCFFSCNDWLDVSPKSEIKADELFKTEAGFKDALIGLYIAMTDQSVYGANLSWQEIEWMAGQYTETNNSFAELQKYNYESTIAKNFIESVWLKEYNIIAEVNLLLESLEENGDILNSTLYNVIKGEALAIRAMCHFDLIRLFAKGNIENRPEILSELCIPYVTAYSKETTERMKQLDVEWKTIGYSGKNDNDRLWDEFKAAKDVFWNAKHENSQERFKALIDQKDERIKSMREQVENLEERVYQTENFDEIRGLQRRAEEKKQIIEDMKKDIEDLKNKLD